MAEQINPSAIDSTIISICPLRIPRAGRASSNPPSVGNNFDPIEIIYSLEEPPINGASYDVSSFFNESPRGGQSTPEYESPDYSLTLKNFINNKPRTLDERNRLDEKLKSDPGLKNPIRDEAKEYFCYLLLDRNIFTKSRALSFTNFVDSIFYVGKGKKMTDPLKRPLDHLREAEKDIYDNNNRSNKIQMIKYLWDKDPKIVILPFYWNVNEAEALSREYTIINAITLPNLTNIIDGTFDGEDSDWTLAKKELLGCHCLENAFERLRGNKIVEINRKNLRDITDRRLQYMFLDLL